MNAPLSLTSLPLFPLEAVLYPGGILALRIFEVRYLTMVRKCHETGAPFGVVSLQSGTEVRRAGASPEQLCNVGTLAHIESLDAPQPGLLLARCLGNARFHIQRHTLLPHGLWVADVEQIP
ncbi:MAG: LON peptidase substrate-binding domain-containing protein, partial [Giesbergeria sp.]